MPSKKITQILKLVLSKGLIAMIPLGVSVLIVYWIFESVNTSVGHYIPAPLHFRMDGIVLFLLITIAVGLFEDTKVGTYIAKTIAAGLAARLSFVLKIYRTCSTVIRAIVNPGNSSSIQGAIFKFPAGHLYSVGFMTSSTVPKAIKERIPFENPAIFLTPTSPNPLTGLVVFIDKSNAMLDLGIQQEAILTVLTSIGASVTPKQPRKKSATEVMLTKVHCWAAVALSPITGVLSQLLRVLTNGLMVVIPLLVVYWLAKMAFRLFLLIATYSSFGMNAFVGPLIGLLVFIACGTFFSMVIGSIVVEKIDSTLRRMPLVSLIYNTTKNILEGVLSGESKTIKAMSSCVLVRYPSDGIYALGIVTSQQSPFVEGGRHVFIPTTPNPTSGYLVIAKDEDLISIDMSVGECTALILSCGMETDGPRQNATVPTADPTI